MVERSLDASSSEGGLQVDSVIVEAAGEEKIINSHRCGPHGKRRSGFEEECEHQR